MRDQTWLIAESEMVGNDLEPYGAVFFYENNCEVVSALFSDDEIKKIDEIKLSCTRYDMDEEVRYWLDIGDRIEKLTGITYKELANFYEENKGKIKATFQTTPDFSKLHQHLTKSEESAVHLYCLAVYAISMWCFGRNRQFKRKSYLTQKANTPSNETQKPFRPAQVDVHESNSEIERKIKHLKTLSKSPYGQDLFCIKCGKYIGSHIDEEGRLLNFGEVECGSCDPKDIQEFNKRSIGGSTPKVVSLVVDFIAATEKLLRKYR